jgi:hypothetical protein
MMDRMHWSRVAQPRYRTPMRPIQKRALASPNQRHRFAFSYVFAPKPFHRDHEWLARMFNN